MTEIKKENNLYQAQNFVLIKLNHKYFFYLSCKSGNFDSVIETEMVNGITYFSCLN